MPRGPDEGARRPHVEGDGLAGDEPLVVEPGDPAAGGGRAAMGSIQADGPRRARLRPPRRLGAARRARAVAGGSTARAPTSSSSGTRPRHPTSRSCRRPPARPRSATGSRSRLARARLRFTGAPENPLRQFTRFAVVEPARRALPHALADARGRRRHVRRRRALRLVDRRRPPGARARSAPRRSCGSSPRRASSRTTPRTRRRRSRARCGRTTRGSPRSASRSASSGVWVPCVILQNAQNLGITAASCSPTTRPTRSSSTSPRTACSSSRACSSPPPRACASSGRGSRRGRGRAAQALAEDARALFTVAIGLVFFLFVSGIIEGVRDPAPGRGR